MVVTAPEGAAASPGLYAPTALRRVAAGGPSDGDPSSDAVVAMVVERKSETLEQNAVVVGVVEAGENAAASRAAHPFVQKEPTSAYATKSADGSALRLRVAGFAAFCGPDNVRLVAAASSARFELLVEGGEHTQRSCAQHLPRSVSSRVGVLRDCVGSPTLLAHAQWNLDPWPYMLVRIIDTAPKAAINIHTVRGNTTPEVLAKLIVSSPYSSAHAQLMDMGCGGYRDFGRIRIQFLHFGDDFGCKTSKHVVHRRCSVAPRHYVQEGFVPTKTKIKHYSN